MSDFTKTVLAFVAVIVFLQLARLTSKIVGNGIAEMGFGALLLFFGYQFDIPYLSNGLRIFGGCLILVGFVALIGSGVDGDVNDEYNNGHQHLEEEKMDIEKMDLKKGRCTPMGTPECPEGSPQYNLAKRFKSGDIHKANLKKGKNPKGKG